LPNKQSYLHIDKPRYVRVGVHIHQGTNERNHQYTQTRARASTHMEREKYFYALYLIDKCLILTLVNYILVMEIKKIDNSYGKHIYKHLNQ